MTSVICAVTIIINLTTESWQKIDQQSLTSAQKRCKVIYEDAPCLKKFTKVEPRVYQAICGGK